MSLSVAFLTLASLLPGNPDAETTILHEQRSLYQIVYVVEENHMRCLRFRKKNLDNSSQSCIDLRHPRQFVFDYYKQAMAANFFVDRPQEILVVGLGGGILVNALESLYPESNLISVEIDPVVVEMARRYFDYDDSAGNKTTVVMDGRVFVRRALRKDTRYDLIILDAFNSDYIPEHMMTREYLQEVRELLSEDGIVVANTYSTSQLFHHESATYAAVFGEIYQVRLPGSRLSRVIIASNNELPGKRELLSRVNALMSSLQQFGVDPLLLYESISDEVNWDTDARILTDQYSPVNLMQGR